MSTHNDTYDVAIAGGGPSGAALARRLAKALAKGPLEKLTDHTCYTISFGCREGDLETAQAKGDEFLAVFRKRARVLVHRIRTMWPFC